MKIRLTKEENEIVKSFENGEWIPATLFKKEKGVDAVRAEYPKKGQRLNIRISARDLSELQRRAVREGLPYQTFVSSIIHKFINGTLVEDRK